MLPSGEGKKAIREKHRVSLSFKPCAVYCFCFVFCLFVFWFVFYLYICFFGLFFVCLFLFFNYLLVSSKMKHFAS